MSAEKNEILTERGVAKYIAQRSFFFWSRAKKKGIVASLSAIRSLLEDVGQDNSLPKLSVIVPFFALLLSLVRSLKDKMLTIEAAKKVVDSLEIDEALKKGLILNIRMADLDDMTGSTGHMIEIEGLMKAVPAIQELSQTDKDKLVDELRKEHYRIQFCDLPDSLSQYIDDFIESLAKGSLLQSKKIIIECIEELHAKVVNYL